MLGNTRAEAARNSPSSLSLQESSGRAHSVPRPAFGGAMLTLLRVRRVARLRRRPELDGASRPLHRAGSLQPSFFGRPRLTPLWDRPRPIRLVNNIRRAMGAARKPLNYESGGQEFESLRARHFGIKLRTPAATDSTLAAATSVRSSSVFDPRMRISLGSTTSTRCASARKWSRR